MPLQCARQKNARANSRRRLIASEAASSCTATSAEREMQWAMRPVDRYLTPAMINSTRKSYSETTRLFCPRSYPSMGEAIPAIRRSLPVVFERPCAVGLSSICPCPKAKVWALLNLVRPWRSRPISRSHVLACSLASIST